MFDGFKKRKSQRSIILREEGDGAFVYLPSGHRVDVFADGTIAVASPEAVGFGKSGHPVYHIPLEPDQ